MEQSCTLRPESGNMGALGPEEMNASSDGQAQLHLGNLGKYSSPPENDSDDHHRQHHQRHHHHHHHSHAPPNRTRRSRGKQSVFVPSTTITAYTTLGGFNCWSPDRVHRKTVTTRPDHNHLHSQLLPLPRPPRSLPSPAV